MTKIFNDPLRFKDEMVEGYVAAYGRYVEKVPDASAVRAVGAPFQNRVAVVIGGGSGHYPVFSGYVGPGMGTAAVIGNIFTSPSAEQVYRCVKAVDGGAGTLLVYGNYSGDVMNFGMAEGRLQGDGLDVRTVLVTDDVSSAPPDDVENRRGIAGDFYVTKVAGAAAWRGDSLDDVEAITRRANAMTRSFGIAFGGCTLPGKTEPLFTVEPGTIGVGLGIHGEPGIRTGEMLPSSGLADLLVDALLDDTPPGATNRAAVLLNGLGGTKYEELFVLYRDVSRRLGAAGLEIHEPLVFEAATSLDMAGCSLTLMWLDDALQALHDAPCSTPGYTRI